MLLAAYDGLLPFIDKSVGCGTFDKLVAAVDSGVDKDFPVSGMVA